MITQQRLLDVFVGLADTLVDEFDVIDFLHTLADASVELLGADAAGVVLADQHGELSVAAASSEENRLLELLELQNEEGPCLDCFGSGRPVVNVDLRSARQRWPSFTASASAAGFRSVHALPLRLRSEVIGALNLFVVHASRLDDKAVKLGQTLADLATISLLQERVVRERQLLAEQLQGAAHSRVVLEQAKGVLAERTGVGVAEGFTLMRRYARGHGKPLAAVATAVVEGTLRIGPAPND